MFSVLASKWLQTGYELPLYEQTQGDSLERTFYTGLLVIGTIVLLRRGQKVSRLLGRNIPIVLFFIYCAASVLWSDYPDVAFKRWIKALGDLVMVLIVLTDNDPLGAIKRLLSRTGFLLIPSSILLIRYYPFLGRDWKVDGRPVFVGVTSDKNALGVLCLIFGLGAGWRLLNGLREQKPPPPPNRRSFLAQGVLFTMVMWLFWVANSMTAFSSFALALGLMVATSFPFIRRNRPAVHLLVFAMLALAVLPLFLSVGASVLGELGRDATLTGRTTLWKQLIGMNPSMLVGAGFESFWLGPRIQTLWSMKEFQYHPNEAHNGYLETYLNLGWVGVVVFASVIAAGYRNALAALRRDPQLGMLSLSYVLTGIIYSFTEAGFRLLNPVWFFFLMAAMMLPKSPARRPAAATAPLAPAVLAELYPVHHTASPERFARHG